MSIDLLPRSSLLLARNETNIAKRIPGDGVRISLVRHTIGSSYGLKRPDRLRLKNACNKHLRSCPTISRWRYVINDGKTLFAQLTYRERCEKTRRLRFKPMLEPNSSQIGRKSTAQSRRLQQTNGLPMGYRRSLLRNLVYTRVALIDRFLNRFRSFNFAIF